MNYYVYAYLDTRKPGYYIYDELNFNYEPFYIGKGKKRRYKNHLCLRSNMENYFYHKLNKIINEGFEPEIIIIRDNLTELEAFEYEKEIIKKIGKIVNNTGSLTNLTDGGEGSSGRICCNETKIKISQANKGDRNGMFHKVHPMKDKSFNEFFGEEKSKKLKKKISNNANPPNKGQKMSKEFCDKVSESINNWYKNNEDVKKRISETLKKRYENKENHPMFGKKASENTKKKLSESLKEHYRKNKMIVSEETKKKMSANSIGDKNPAFTVYKIKNLETSEILIFYGSKEFRDFIRNFKTEKGSGRTSPPSINLIMIDKTDKYFQLIDKYYPNRKLNN